MKFILQLIAFGVTATILGVALAFALYADALSFLADWLRAAIFFAYIGGCIVTAFRLVRYSPPKKAHVTEAELEAQGRIAEETHSAVRCVEVEEFEDEGMHYVFEMPDGRALYLTGQYLYDLVDNEKHASPVFPCTDFTLRRIKDGGFGLRVTPRGTHLSPIEVFPDECTAAFYEDWNASNGDFLPVSFEEARRVLASRRTPVKTRR